MTQLALFHVQPTQPVRPIAAWVDGSDVIAARLERSRRRALPAVGLTRTQQAQSWLRAARWWPAGSRQREDFKERAMWLIGQEDKS